MSVIQRLHRWIWPQRGERLKAVIVYGLVGALIAGAVTLTGVRLLFAAAPSMVATVEAAVSARLQVPIRIGGLDARLHQLRPGLVLRDVEVGDPQTGAQPVKLAEMTLAIAPWASIEAGGLRLHALEASGLTVSARHTAGDGWQFSGLLPVASAATPDGFLDALRGLPVDQLLLRDARVRIDHASGQSPLMLDPVTLRWRREETGDWRFALDARRGEEQLQGRLLVPGNDQDNARGFVEFNGLRSSTIAAYLPAPVPPLAESAEMDARAWLALDNAGLQSATVTFDGRALGLLDGELSSASLRAHLARSGEGWAGRIVPEQVRGTNAAPLDVGPLAFAFNPQDTRWRWAAERLPLALLKGALAEQMTGNPDLMPSGEIQQLQGVWTDASDWQVQAIISALAVQAKPPWPVIEGGDVEVRFGPNGGAASLKGLNLSAGLPELLRAPVALDEVGGDLLWWRGEGEDAEWRLQARDFVADWQGVPVSLDAHYWLPAINDPIIDLKADVGGVPLETVMAHLPVGIMHEQLVAYLDRAVLDGRVESLALRFKGSPANFPFDDNAGVFDLSMPLSAVDFQFNRNWPALREVDAQLRFYNRGLSILALSGEIEGIALDGAEASIENLWQPRLQIDGDLSGPLPAMHDLMLASPLLSPQSPLAAFDWEGAGDLSLSLYFPFQRKPPEVSGALQVDGATLTLPSPVIRLTDLRGEVSFDGDGLRWEGLRGRFNNRPLVSRAVNVRADNRPRTRIEADTRMALTDWPGLAGLAGQARGDTAWRVIWEGPGFDGGRLVNGPTQLRVESALQGLALDWPLQLGKTAEQSVPTRFDWHWLANGEQRMNLAYGDRMQAAAAQEADAALGLAVHLGSEPAATPQSGMTRITGVLPRLRLAELTALASGDNSLGGESSLPPVQAVDLTLQGLDVNRWRLAEIQVAGVREADDWRLGLAGAAYGDMRWSPQARQVTIDLERLQASTIPVAEREQRSPESDTDAPVPAGPDIRLEVDALSAEGLPLGQLSFSRINEGQPDARASLALVGETVDLRAQIEPDAEQAGAHALRFDLFTEDAGGLLRALGLPRAMDAGTGSSSGELSWIGPMLDPAMTSLRGDLQVDLRNGALPAVEPGAGRALGLFSLSVLPRRLGLDFSDVVGEGLQFDSLQGSWQVQAGRLQTDDLRLQGPSMDLGLSGVTDLVRRRYDQQVRVTPHVSSALTFLGGLAGGPAAAVMLFLTRGMIEPGVERLTAFEYRIFGPWEDPQFELLTPLTAGQGEGNGNE